MDPTTIRSVYLIGIKGAGMTALAQVLQARGVRVSGSDTAQHFYTDDVLRRAGIPFVEGFAAANVPNDVDIAIRSTAYGEDHVEVVEATRRGLSVTTYPEALAAIFNAGKGIAVCGTHGKSTTTALLGYVLAEAGLDPTVIVGAEVPQFNGNARAGQSELIVIEADEYQDKLRYLTPFGVVLTNVEWDHPDFFTTPATYEAAFERFIARIPPHGFLVADGSDRAVQRLTDAAQCPTENHSNILKNVGMSLAIPGEHNQHNARAVIAAAEQLGVSRDVAFRAIASFQGTRRRFEVVGVVQSSRLDIVIIDDYGHHPTEIRVTLEAARERYPGRRIFCAFHPHTFTRTIAFKDQFATAFVGADHTYVMDIFGSAREQQGGIDAAGLASTINAHSPAIASGNVEQTVAALVRDVHPGDIVLCMGAGENDRVARGLVERLRENAGVRNPM